MRDDSSRLSTLRRKRRKHPTMIRTQSGVEEVIPGLSTWTAEDLVEAGAWDEDLAQIAEIDLDLEEVEEEVENLDDWDAD